MRFIPTTFPLALCLLFNLQFCIPASAQDFDWARQIASNYESYVLCLDVDAAGNVISAGRFTGIIDLDPGPGFYNVSASQSTYNTFIQKLDSNGQFLWGGTIQGNGLNDPRSLITDASGNIYLLGYVENNADFDIGPGIDSAGCASRGTFLMRLSPSGQYQWVRTLDNVWLQDEAGHVMVMDSATNLYLAGQYSGTVDFDPGPGVHNMLGGFQTPFFASYDSLGGLNWVSGIGGSATVFYTLTLDGAGLYVAGTFMDTCDFDPGPGITMLDDSTSLQPDLFIARYSLSGAFHWVRSVELTDYFWIHGIEADGLGGLTASGNFHGNLDLDPGPGIDLHSSTGPQDLFLLQLDRSGNFRWGRSIHSTALVEGRGMAHDADGNVYVAVQFSGTTDFDPGPGMFSQPCAGGEDVALLKLDSVGGFVWVAPVAGAGQERACTVRLDASGSIYMGGKFTFTTDFAPQAADTALMTAMNYIDGFVLKWRQDSCTNLLLRIDTTADVSCSLGLGLLQGSAMGGAAPYSYSWNTLPPTLDSVATPAAGGIYTLSVTDSSGCTATRSALINGPSSLGGFDLETHAVLSNFRPNSFTAIRPDVSNQGCLSVAGQFRLVLDPQTQFTSALVPPASIVGDTLLWNLPPMNHDSAHWTNTVYVLTSSLAQLGDTVRIGELASPTLGDTEPLDNSKLNLSIVSNAFDPNRKDVYPLGECVEHYVLRSDPLTYTIQFQNTGTAEALEVAILDTLDPHLDLASVVLKGHSHPMVTEVLPGNVLRFVFHNIHLPDSNANEPASHGYVVFEVMPATGTPPGTAAHNGAAIYFDFNPPVLTNVVTNTLVDVIPACAVGAGEWTESDGLRMHPNPAHEGVRLESDVVLGDVVVHDLMGRVIWTGQASHETSLLIPVEGWTKGLYLVRVGKMHPKSLRLVVE